MIFNRVKLERAVIFIKFIANVHCLKSVCIRSYTPISPYSVWMPENADQNNLEYGQSLFFYRKI